jgi:hypothetical protein
MNKMIAADGGRVSVAHDHNHLEGWLGKLDPCRKSQSAPVGRMQGVEVCIYGHAARTSDTGYENDIVLSQTGSVNGSNQGSQHNAVSATGTPYVRKFFIVTQIFIS